MSDAEKLKAVMERASQKMKEMPTWQKQVEASRTTGFSTQRIPSVQPTESTPKKQ